MKSAILIAWLVIMCMTPSKELAAETIRVAVAANFSHTLDSLVSAYSQTEDSNAPAFIISQGSTGRLYAQIIQGAPFDLFLSADEQRPKLLEAGEHAIKGSRKTYALGRLVLWSLQPNPLKRLRHTSFERLAIANPLHAPYGKAAEQFIDQQPNAVTLKQHLVIGENVTQAYQFAASGNADLALIPMAIKTTEGEHWLVPASEHSPIRQQVIRLTHGQNNKAAEHFHAWLSSSAARLLITESGYALPDE